MTYPFFSVLKTADLDPLNLPHGAIVATAMLLQCVRIPAPEDAKVTSLRWNDRWEQWCVPPDPAAGHEIRFGNYEEGRYAWLLCDITPLEKPIPVRGHLGLWEWEAPEGVSV